MGNRAGKIVESITVLISIAAGFGLVILAADILEFFTGWHIIH